MDEIEIRATSMHVIELYGSGTPKDQIAKMMNISRNDVNDIIDHRGVLGR